MSKIIKTLVAANLKLASVQKEMAAKEVTGSAGGGVVTVTVSGQHEPKAVTMAPEVLKEDAETVQDLILAALRDAYNKVDADTKAKTAAISKSLSPFGLMPPN